MNRLTWATEALRLATRLLRRDRGDWTRALMAEADEVPARRRPAWLAGGFWLTASQARLVRRLGYPAAFAAAAAGTAWTAWSGPPGDAAIAINRVDVITIAVILAGLPLVVRRARGPASRSRAARLVRAGGVAPGLAPVLVHGGVA